MLTVSAAEQEVSWQALVVIGGFKWRLVVGVASAPPAFRPVPLLSTSGT